MVREASEEGLLVTKLLWRMIWSWFDLGPDVGWSLNTQIGRAHV